MNSARKSQVSDFVSLTGCSEKQATRLLENAKWNIQEAINIFYDQGILPEPEELDKISEVEQLAAKWAGKDERNKENIGEDGLEDLFNIIKVDLTNPVVGFIMIIAMGMEKAGEATKANIYNLLRYTHSHSLSQVAAKVPELEKEMIQRKDLYKQTYDKLFEFYSVTKIPTLDFDTAQQLWEIYLKGVMLFHPQFMDYLKSIESKPSKVHKDLWRMMYEFANTVDSIEKYNEDQGWPVFIDEFVEFLKKK